MYTTDHGETYVYDLDTILDFPASFIDYVKQTFGSDDNLKPQFRRYFRVIRADVFLERFASDRSHMLSETGEWMSPPPSYPPILTAESANNLQDFISMQPDSGYGEVMQRQTFATKFQ